MALIKCPECGKEISDNAESCPHCGYPINKKEDSKQEEVQKSTEQKEKKPLKKRYLVIFIIIVLIAGIIVWGCIKTSKEKKLIEQQNAEVQEIKEYNQYVECLNSVYSNALSGASTAEDVCVLVLNVWQDAIYDDSSDETSKYVSGASDFNEALERVYADEEIKDKLSSISDYQEYLDNDMNNLQSAPSELEKAYDAAVEVSTTFKSLAKMAESPSGSYNSFSSDEKDNVNAFISAYNTLESVIPAKKEVPKYDSKGNQVEDELSFLLYLNQMTNKLPSSAQEYLLGNYQDEAVIEGLNGKIWYSVHNKVVQSITWKTDKINQENEEKLLSYLKLRYGKPQSEDKSLIMWTQSDITDNLAVSYKIEDGSLEIIWF